MNRPEDGKKYYDKIEIPEELQDRVEDAIDSVDRRASLKKHRRYTTARVLRYSAATAAAVLVCMTIGLNTSEVFAKEMSELPVIGSFARVLTVRSYHENDDGHDIQVKVPGIQVENDGGTSEESTESETFIGDINVQIQKIVDDYVAAAKQHFAEYKEAFFATGGTEEEWADRDIAVNVDYEVKYQKGNVLSMVLTADEAWVSAYGVRYYYNLELKEERQLTLKDILGDDYIVTANESIVRQMKERMAADEMQIYWGMGSKDEENMIDGFITVDENTKFYINENGNPVICFDKYEVAPGSMGRPEFEIIK